jgi:hypothetical protein
MTHTLFSVDTSAKSTRLILFYCTTYIFMIIFYFATLETETLNV